MTAVSSQLDSAEYDPIDHLNALFPSSSALPSVADTVATLHDYEDDLDEDISSLVAAQTTSNTQSIAQIQAAKAELTDLFAKIESVRKRAMETERSITDMTADIKRLDSTKKNLTLSMTALKRLQMLTTAYEQLKSLSRTRQYRDCAQLLAAVIQLSAHFKSYRSIDQIATLSRNVAELQRELLEQVCEDFEVVFAKGEVGNKKNMLSEACGVMDALGDHARMRLVTWYCNTQLREYRQVFRGNEEAGSLDNISRRYSWFTRMMKTYDLEHVSIFPPHWKVNEQLANAFCEGTRDDYKSILHRSMRRTEGQQLDVNLLLSCLQETLNFEHGLEAKFRNAEARSSIDTLTSVETQPSSFSQSISSAFEPYLSLWVESQEKQLATMIPQYRAQPIHPPEEEFTPQTVMPSSTDLFNFYRVSLQQCAKLSTGAQLLALSKTFAKFLDQYAQQVLFPIISASQKSNGPSMQDAVAVLNTADYCYTTCNQLEEKIKGRIDEEFRNQVDLQSQADAFMGIASAAIRSLVAYSQGMLEPAWREMRAVAWARLESVGDQSTYVADLLNRTKSTATEVLALLHKQQYARAFSDNLVETLAHSFLNNVVASRPISEVGAEQLLLDSYVLKKGFMELGTLNQKPTAGEKLEPPAAFVKRVNQGIDRLSPLLKTISVRPQPPEALVQAYLIHIGDRSDANFRKLLELKGIKTAREQQSLLDLFQAHKSSPNNSSLPLNTPLLTGLQLLDAKLLSTATGLSGLSTPLISGTSGRFDPGAFGSAIVAAARDGVDRFASPSPGTGATVVTSGTRVVSGAEAKPDGVGAAANINENLRNLGKFFRRDTGGFKGFGRATE